MSPSDLGHGLLFPQAVNSAECIQQKAATASGSEVTTVSSIASYRRVTLTHPPGFFYKSSRFTYYLSLRIPRPIFIRLWPYYIIENLFKNVKDRAIKTKICNLTILEQAGKVP